MIAALKKEYPDADCTLDYNEAWKLLVSVRLAAQCTDARVNVVVQDLYKKFPDVKALAEATKTLNENEAVYFQKSLDFLNVMIQNAEFTDPEEAWFQ